jgi:hypothetical protein
MADCENPNFNNLLNGNEGMLYFNPCRVSLRIGFNQGNLWSNPQTLGQFSFGIGTGIVASGLGTFAVGTQLSAGADFAMILGRGPDVPTPLVNNTPNSLMIGYMTTVPSLFVGEGNGSDGPGRVALGHATPEAQNHLRGSLVVDGFTDPSYGTALPTGAGTRLVFQPQNGAFRAGTVTGTQWDAPNLGFASFVAGNNLVVSAQAAAAFGADNTVAQAHSLVAGQGNTVTNSNPEIGTNMVFGQTNTLTNQRGAFVTGLGNALNNDNPEQNRNTVLGVGNTLTNQRGVFVVGASHVLTGLATPDLNQNSIVMGQGIELTNCGTNNYVLGTGIDVTEADAAIAIGSSHTLNSTTEALVIGQANGVDNSSRAFVFGRENAISGPGNENMALGYGHRLNGAYNSVFGRRCTTGSSYGHLLGEYLELGSNSSGSTLVGSYLKATDGPVVVLGLGLGPDNPCVVSRPNTVNIATMAEVPMAVFEGNRMSLNMGNTPTTANFHVNGNAAIGYTSEAIAPKPNGLLVRGVTGIGATSSVINEAFQLNVLGTAEAPNPLLVQGPASAPFLIWGRSIAGGGGYDPNQKMLELESYEAGIAFRVYASGRTEVGENLKVDGNIQAGGNMCALEFVADVSPSCVPDYVFEPDYKLMPLDDLRRYVQANKHLPGIPSATDMSATGQRVNELQLRLLEKVEEQTLYILQLQRELQHLKQELRTSNR